MKSINLLLCNFFHLFILRKLLSTLESVKKLPVSHWGLEWLCVCWAVFLASPRGVVVSWEVLATHTHVSSPYRFFTLLGLALPLAGTAYVAARGWGSDHKASPAQGTHSATYGSLPLTETESSEPGNRTQRPGGRAHVSLSGAASRGKSRHFNKLRPLVRGT